MKVEASPSTVVEAFMQRASERSQRSLWYERVGRRWQATTWGDASSRVAALGAGLASLGIRPGDRVGLVGPNSSRWVTADYAIQMIGAVTVPLHHSSPGEDWGDIIDRSQTRVCCVDGEDLLARLQPCRPILSHVVALHREDDHDDTIGIGALRGLGEAWLRAHPDEIRDRIGALRGDDPATAIFTSGTTGAPKGVILTHRNLVATARAAVEAVPVRRREVLLSYLPISHAFERLITTVVPLVTPSSSWTVWFVEDINTLPVALRSVRPSIMVGVPLFWQRLRQRITAELGATTLPRRLLGRSLSGLESADEMDEGGRFAALTRPLVRQLGRTLLTRAGLKRCWLALSGAAPIDVATQVFFRRLGLPIHQGWGLTETTALSTVQRPGDDTVGVVGVPLPGVEVRIDSDGEVLVRGPNVFTGYLEEPPPGSPTVDANGYLHTGDLGELLEEGRLRILDRIDDMIVTSGGRKVAPRQIESRLAGDSLIEAAMVFGQARPHLVALLALDGSAVARLIPESSVPLWAHPEVEGRVKELIKTVNQSLPEPERIHRWAILPLGFPDEALTPTLKVRRRVVEELLASTIEGLYD